jgi:cytochrome c peroxidase
MMTFLAALSQSKGCCEKFYICPVQKAIIITVLIALVSICVSFTNVSPEDDTPNLRKIYSQSPDKWPAPFVDPGVAWTELGKLPAGPLYGKMDSLKNLVALGKILFFEPRLSGSGKISCASCHQPELSWTDGRDRSLGHEGTINKRNSPSLQNVWFYKRLFWDGRSSSLEDQAFAPINSESEMHGDMRGLPGRLRRIPGYASLFDSAFGDPGIDPDRVAGALAAFQRTISSRKSKFDLFIEGERKALSNNEIRGLHLFRTKARCMNCHHGPLFSDNNFHNTGFGDVGLYHVTHREEDRGKMKTPSLRDVAYTGPWLHDGSVTNLSTIISRYNHAKDIGRGIDNLLKPLGLTASEQRYLQAFLGAISAPPLEFQKPILPK